MYSYVDVLASLRNCKNMRDHVPRPTDSGWGSATGTGACLKSSGVALRVFLHQRVESTTSSPFDFASVLALAGISSQFGY
jgi:hypothetical protein